MALINPLRPVSVPETMPTIAITSYLNTRPLLYHRALANFRIRPLAPAVAVSALLKGEIDAGIVPVAGLSRLGNDFELLGSYGIACEGPVHSVALFSRIPFADFNHSHRVMLSRESISSNKLLQLLFAARRNQNTRPLATSHTGMAEGELVIGDRALLRFYNGQDAYITDLCAEWARLHKKPFVFARWVIRKDKVNSYKQTLLDWLAAFIENESALIAETVDQQRLNYPALNELQMLDYLQRIRHFIGLREQQGQNQFVNAIQRLPEPWVSRQPEPSLLKAS